MPQPDPASLHHPIISLVLSGLTDVSHSLLNGIRQGHLSMAKPSMYLIDSRQFLVLQANQGTRNPPMSSCERLRRLLVGCGVKAEEQEQVARYDCDASERRKIRCSTCAICW